MNFTFNESDKMMMSLNANIELYYWSEVLYQHGCWKQEGRILDEEEFLQELYEDEFGLGEGGGYGGTNIYLECCKGGFEFNDEMLSDMRLFVIKMAEERLQDVDSAEIDTLEKLVNRYAYDFILNNYLGWGFK